MCNCVLLDTFHVKQMYKAQEEPCGRQLQGQVQNMDGRQMRVLNNGSVWSAGVV